MNYYNVLLQISIILIVNLIDQVEDRSETVDILLFVISDNQWLMQDCSISIANTLEILQSCTKPWKWCADPSDSLAPSKSESYGKKM